MPILGSLARAVFPLTLAALAACGGQNDDPEGAKQLFDKVNQGAGFRIWERAPGYSVRRPSFTAHADEVEIFVNAELLGALRGATSLLSWPVGSIVVKEGFAGGDRKLVAIMEKRASGWYWAEYDADGEAVYSGSPKICLDCHDNRSSYSDWIYAFEFPR